MATEMITLKLESEFLKQIDTAVKSQGYQSRTEFIRGAIRKELRDQKVYQRLMEFEKNISKRKYSRKDLGF